MIAAAIGVPSAYTDWCLKALNSLAKLKTPQIAVRSIDRSDDVPSQPEDPSLFVSRYPSRSLADLANAPHVRCILLCDDAVAVVSHIVASGKPFKDAIRSASASCALISEIARHPSAVALHRHSTQSETELIRHLADFIQCDLSADEVEKIRGDLGPSRATGSDPAPHLNTEQSEIIKQVLDPLYRTLARGGLAPVEWPFAVFLSGDNPDHPADLVMDLTGAARILYYGPYFHLARAEWEACASIGFSNDAIGMSYSIEAHSDKLLGRALFRPEKPGLFSVTFTFRVEQPDRPVELRFQSSQGAIEGRVGLAKVTLAPSPVS